MSREILENIINDFQVKKFDSFFREKNPHYAPSSESLDQYNDEDFSKGLKLGHINFPNKDDKLIVCSFEANKSLSERSGKKLQYDKGKKILPFFYSNAGIFIFYDNQGNFRFSLIYRKYLGPKLGWSNFKRFTYFVSKEFTNKTFYSQIVEGDFSSLDSIKNAFSVEKVTKEFYTAIAYWYFWAVRNVTFPKDAKSEAYSREMAVIRMITRLVFIWFMKEKGLINKVLFDRHSISNKLKDISPQNTTYYKAILQNLFFATLNTKIKDRKFRFKITGWKNSSFIKHDVYRYEDYFKNKDDMLEIFKDIPFLNGGLFECLDRRIIENSKNKRIRIDGFSDKDVGLKVPNFLFFSDDTNVDLNEEYGTKSKRYNVRGLISTLSSYNFTIDENVPDDQEVALDPELLGKVFENLLASFNPATATTARKATGSYNTPREIVDYMVTQSLKTYFKTHLKDIENLENKLENLFSSSNNENPFPKDTLRIIRLIDNLRIVDPAVGSGAFPMGILNKLVFLLSKLDPNNIFWKEIQIRAVEESVSDPNLKRKLKEQIEILFTEKNLDYGRKLYLIQNCIYGVDIQEIAIEIAKLRFFISLLVDEKIDRIKENWGIEPLPNLDFKLMQGNSLLELISPQLLLKTIDKERNQFVEEFNILKKEYFTIDPSKKDKKREEINSLLENIVEHDRLSSIQNQLVDIKMIKNQGVLFEDRKQERTRQYKISEIEKRIKELKKLQIPGPSVHFEWNIDFSEVFYQKEGFDIIIANPPYMKERGNKHIFEVVNNSDFGRKYHQGKMDYWYYFLHKAIDISPNNSVISYITSRYWLNSTGANKLIQRVKKELSFLHFIDIGKLKVFDKVAGQHMVAIYSKSKNYDKFIYKKLENNISDINKESDTENLQIKYLSNKNVFSDNNEIILERAHLNLKGTTPLVKVTDTSIGVQESPDKINHNLLIRSERKDISIGDGVFVITDNELERLKLNKSEKSIIKKYLDPNDVFRYNIKWNNKYLIYSDKKAKYLIKNDHSFFNIKKHLDNMKEFITSSNRPYGIHRPRKIKYFSNPKIIFKNMFIYNEFAYDEDSYFVGFSFSLIIERDKNYNLKYILSILNSKLALNWFYKYGKKRGAGVDIGVKKLRSFPIKIASPTKQEPFVEIIDNIHEITKDENYLNNSTKQAKVREYEKQINQMVYKLYGLTEDEIKIIEGDTL
jgi:hypothetical protein